MKTIFSDNVVDSDPDNSISVDDVGGLKVCADKPLLIHNAVREHKKKNSQPATITKGLSKTKLNFSKYLNSDKGLSSMFGLDSLAKALSGNFIDGFKDSLNEEKRPLSTKARKHMKEALENSSTKNSS